MVTGGLFQRGVPAAVAFVVAVGMSLAPAQTVGASRRIGQNLGVNITITEALASDLDALATSKATWVRFDAFWVGIQKGGKTSWDWGQLDEQVIMAESRGLNVLLLPTYAPEWAALPGCRSGRCGPISAADYVDFVGEAARRYSPGGTLGTHVRAWEIWNEPNGPGFGPDPDPVKYTEMLKGSFRVIRAVNPTAEVLTGGTAPAPYLPDKSSYTPARFLTQIYKNGGKGSFTAVANHPYSGIYEPMYKAPWNAFYQTPKLHEIMASYGDDAKKIWGTEFGYSSSENPEFGLGEELQALLLGVAVLTWNTWSFGGPLFVFNLRDRSEADLGKFDTTGMLRYDGSPKVSWRMFKKLSRVRM
jgi:hypothetical protein